MTGSANILADFPTDQFDIYGYCESCGHSGKIDRTKLPGDLSMDALDTQMICSACGGRKFGVRIVYKGAGEYHYG